ncbi:MAG TPA: hypothetical protein VIV11_25340 [Kofleriaceae bacterium]
MVKVRGVMVMAALAGCGQPTPLPCTGYGVGVCSAEGLCIAGWCAEPDMDCASGYRYHESAGSLGGDCTDGSGSGSGGSGQTFADDPHVLLPGDIPMTVDASQAADDVDPACAAPDGKDVMFDITVPIDLTRIYVDTHETNYPIVLAVYEGSCVSQTKKFIECVDAGLGSCDAKTKQWSKVLRPGPHCIVVDQPPGVLGSPNLAAVRAMFGPPVQPATAGVTSGSTCANDWGPSSTCISPDGPDTGWFFMACSGNFTARIPTPWVGDLELRGGDGAPLACTDAGAGLAFSMTRPEPRWIVAHQDGGSCGTVTITIQ